MRRLDDFAEHVRESTTPSANDPRRYVALEHLIPGDPFVRRWADASSARSSKFVFQAGDILYGKLRPYLDKAGLVGFDGVASTDLLVLRPRNDIDSQFLAYTMHSRPVRDYAIATTAGVNHPRTSWSSLRELEVFAPSLEEQQRIVGILSALQRVREGNRAERSAASDMKDAFLRDIFAAGPKRDLDQVLTENGMVPKSWSITALDQVAMVQTGVAKGRRLAQEPTVVLPYLRVANVQDGRLDLSEMKTISLPSREVERYLLRPGDVVVTEGGDSDKLGRGFLWSGQVEQCVHQNHIFAIRPSDSRLLPKFLSYFIQSPLAKSYFLNVAHRTTNLACINSTKLKALPIPLPTVQEQHLIISLFERVDSKLHAIDEVRHAVDNLLGAAMKSLLQPSGSLP